MKFAKISLLAGTVLLGLGVGLYLHMALNREGSVLWPFLCCMASLFFFNLPAVIQRYNEPGTRAEKDRAHEEEP